MKTQYPTISTSVTLLFNLYVIVWWLDIGIRKPFFASIRFEFLLGLVLGILALYQYYSKPRETGNSTDIVRWIFLYLGVLFVSLPLAVDFETAWNAYVNRVLKFALLSFFISQFVVSPKTLSFYLISSFLAFLRIGYESFLGKVSGSMIWENQGILRLHGPTGTSFAHPNSLSGKTVSMLSFVWYLFPTINRPWLKLLLLVQVIFAFNIIVFTGSRTGYVAFLAILAIIIISSHKKWKMLLYSMLFLMIVATQLPEQYIGRFMSTFTGHEIEGFSYESRVDLFKDSLTVFSENPLGVGLYCFPVAQRIAARNPQETHNLYTQILAETGLQGFVCFMGLLYVVMRKILKVKQALENIISTIQTHVGTDDSEDSAVIKDELRTNKFLLAVTNSLIMFIIVRLVLGIFGHDLLEIYWWLSAGIAMSLANLLEISQTRVNEIHLMNRKTEIPN